MKLKVPSLLTTGLSFILFAATARTQTEPPRLEFTFASPGARSLAFGGAFAGLADDATAAFSNPAGLVQLSRPEVSIEFRGWADVTSLASDASPSGLRTSSSLATVSGVGFLSFAYPRENWSFAFYRHELANFESVSAIEGFIQSPVPLGEFSPFVDARTGSELQMITYGLSGAYRLKENLSVGVGVVYYGGRLQSRTDFLRASGTDVVSSSQAQAGSETIIVDSSDWGLNAGFLWHIDPQWNLGGFYRQAPSFAGTAEEVSGPFNASAQREARRSQGQVRFPDTFGLGTIYKSKNGAFTASLEWDHVRYAMVSTGLFEDVDLDDGDEIHLGLEYAFLGITPVVGLRVGTWREPEREIRFLGEGAQPGSSVRRGGRWHVAFGGGVAFWRIQLDFGVDVSKFVATASFSAIVSF